MTSKNQNFALPDRSLTQEQEQQLASANNEDAWNALVMNNIRHGFAYARTYCGTRFEDDELLSVVYKALMSAAKRFEAGGQSMICYAKPFIRGELHRAWKSSRPLGVQLPEDTVPPSDGPLPSGDEQVVKPNVVVEYVDFDFDALEAPQRRAQVEKLLRRLGKHERTIVDLIFWGGLSLTDVGKLTRTSRQTVHQVVDNVLKKFRSFVS